ncbi:hypothetical protein SBADM41S_01892 [Streptomyces badius]
MSPIGLCRWLHVSCGGSTILNSNTFRLAAVAVAAAPVVLLAAVPAHAAPAMPTTGGEGRASAVVLRTGLDVSLLNKSVQVPLKVTLNEVQAPASAEKTALTVNLDGVQGRPVDVLRADVATADATVDEHRAEGYTNLAKARIDVPGLAALPLVEVEKVTSKALCEAGKQPVAESNVPRHVVRSEKATLSVGGLDPGVRAGRRRGHPRPVQDGHHRAHGGGDGPSAQGGGQPAEAQRRRGQRRGHPRRGDLRDPEGAEHPEEPSTRAVPPTAVPRAATAAETRAPAARAAAT